MDKTNKASVRILASIKVGHGLKGSPTKDFTRVNLTNKNKECIICIECKKKKKRYYKSMCPTSKKEKTLITPIMKNIPKEPHQL